MLPFFRPITNSSIVLFRAQRYLPNLPSTPSKMQRYKSSGKKKHGVPKNPPLTHFLCIPLVNPTSRPQLESSIKKFREDICSAVSTGSVTEDPTFSNSPKAEDKTPPFQASSISEKAVRPVDTLHLTLGVMSLDKDKLAQATELLKTLDINSLLHDCTAPSTTPTTSTPRQDPNPPFQVPNPGSQQSDPPNPITLTLNSLTSMHNPSSTSILYITPQDPTTRLHTLCTHLRSIFTEANFLVPDIRPLKLHATVLNTIYAKPGRDNAVKSTSQNDGGKAGEKGKHDTATKTGHRPAAKAPLKLDAREILKRYETFTWAEGVTADRISICEMGAKKIFDAPGDVIREKYVEVGFRKL